MIQTKRTNLSILAITLLALSCSSSDELEIKNEEDLEAFLRNTVSQSESQIEKIREAHATDEEGISPRKVELSENNRGLIWERDIIGDFSPEQVEALKVLFEIPYTDLKYYCQGQALKLMQDFGYFLHEKHYANGNILVTDYLVNNESCNQFLETQRIE